ncbi:MAG: VanW family protein [Patescibacteria group bacterium]
MKNILLTFILFLVAALSVGAPMLQTSEAAVAHDVREKETLLGKQEMSLENRHRVSSVNAVFRDNMLLTLWYMSGKVEKPSAIDWDAIRKSATFTVTLKPGETFAFHDDILPKYAGTLVQTTNAHFNQQEGFLTDGLYYGDGVCHLASLITWAATDAGLAVYAPVRHDFAPVPAMPREYGTSIYVNPGVSSGDQMQNTYVTNNQDATVKLVFVSTGKNLTLEVVKVK